MNIKFEFRNTRNHSESSEQSQPPRYEEMRNNFLSVVHVPVLDLPLTRVQKPNMSNSLLNLNVLKSDNSLKNNLKKQLSLKNSASEPSLYKPLLCNQNYFFQNNLLKIVPIQNDCNNSNNDETYLLKINDKTNENINNPEIQGKKNIL
jgi:hypothetical protein